ncbi:Proteasome subunit beta type-3 [Hordeum vulgare]|nr:Proteasome subunit beta type-3 [Hordeum vulgare]
MTAGSTALAAALEAKPPHLEPALRDRRRMRETGSPTTGIHSAGFARRFPPMAVRQIFEYNGSAMVAMVGKNCFAIASDRRLSVQLQTVATDFERVFKIHGKLCISLSGLASDA